MEQWAGRNMQRAGLGGAAGQAGHGASSERARSFSLPRSASHNGTVLSVSSQTAPSTVHSERSLQQRPLQQHSLPQRSLPQRCLRQRPLQLCPLQQRSLSSSAFFSKASSPIQPRPFLLLPIALSESLSFSHSLSLSLSLSLTLSLSLVVDRSKAPNPWIRPRHASSRRQRPFPTSLPQCPFS